jgi:hypothetical protein
VSLTSAQFAVVFQAREASQKLAEDDEAGLRELMAKVYGALGRPAPVVYRFHSPLAAMLAAPHLGALHQVSHLSPIKAVDLPLRSLLGTRPISRTRERLEALREGELLSPAFTLPIRAQLGGKFVDSYTDKLCSILRAGGGDDLVNQRMKIGFFNDIHPPILDWWIIVAPSPVWWWLYPGLAIVSGRPSNLKFAGERLHADDGPAADFRDGHGCYFWRGVAMPRHAIENPSSITLAEIQAETNAEVRRVLILRMGAGEYLKQCKAKVIDMDSLTLDGSAPRALMEDSFGNRWLIGTDGSTARVYTMPVPREARTCRDAHRLIAGFDESRLIAEA